MIAMMVSLVLIVFVLLYVCFKLKVISLQSLTKGQNFRPALIIFSICLACFVLGFYLNPDILKAYRFESDQRALTKAKSILADKTKLKHLIKVLETQIRNHPDDIKAQVLLARIYAGQDEWEKAYHLIARVYPQHLKDLKTSLFYVESSWHQKGHLDKKGRAILTRLLTQNPNQIDSLMMLATDAKSRSCFKEALPYLQRLSILFASDEKMKTEIDKAILNAQAQKKSACLAPF